MTSKGRCTQCIVVLAVTQIFTLQYGYTIYSKSVASRFLLRAFNLTKELKCIKNSCMGHHGSAVLKKRAKVQFLFRFLPSKVESTVISLVAFIYTNKWYSKRSFRYFSKCKHKMRKFQIVEVFLSNAWPC